MIASEIERRLRGDPPLNTVLAKFDRMLAAVLAYLESILGGSTAPETDDDSGR